MPNFNPVMPTRPINVGPPRETGNGFDPAGFSGQPRRERPIGMPERPMDGIPSFHKGTDKVEKTGLAVLKKGEAVLNTKDAAKLRAAKRGTGMEKHEKHKVMEAVSDSLSGKKEEKHKKEIEEMHIKKAANGGHIIKHIHKHPEEHPSEEHTTKTDDELADHVLQGMGTQNPGEAEADAGQSGMPSGAGATGAAPPNAAMGSTPSPVEV